MKFKVLFTLIFCTLSACHKTNPLVQPHEQEKENLEHSSVSQAGIQSNNIDKPAHAGPMTYELDIKPLEKSLLDANELLNPKTSQSANTRDNLSHLNQAILQIYSRDPSSLSRNQILEKYAALLLHGCDANLSFCDAVDILKQDPMSTDVALLIARSKVEVSEYYRFLLIAFTLKNRESRPQLLSMYLARSNELIEFVKANPESKLFAQNQNLLSIILEDNTIKQDANFLKIIDTFSPWEYSSRNGSNQNALKILLASANNLYDKSGALTPSFTRAVENIQMQNNSFKSLEDELFSSHPLVVANLGLNKLDAQGEYFYIIDRLFTENIQVADAYQLWDHTNQNYEIFSKTLKSYAQIVFIEKVLKAHSQMSDIFSPSRPVPASQFFDQVKFQSSVISNDLKNFLKKLSVLNQVAGYVLAKRGLVRDATTDYLDAAPKNVYYYVVLPHMMMLAHEMYKKAFHEEIDFGYGPEPFDGSNVTQLLYHNTYLPWFDYSSLEKVKVNVFDIPTVKSQELFYAFDIALNTQAFEIFHVDAGDYLFDLFTQLFGRFNFILADDLNNFQTHFYSDNDWANAIQLCHGIESGQGFDHTVDAREPYDRVDKISRRSDFEKGALIGGLAVKLQSKDGFQFHNDDRVNRLEYLRVLDEPTQHMFDLYLKLYKTYITKTHGDQSKVQVLEGLHLQIQNSMRSYAAQISKIQNEYTHCYFTLFKRELEEQDKILGKRIEILKSIYADMVILRSHPNQRSELNQKYHFIDMGVNSLGTERFDQNVYHALVIDFIVDAKRMFEQSNDPVEKLTHIYFPEDPTYLQEFKRPKIVNLSFTDSEADFVANGLNAIMASTSSQVPAYVGWFEGNFLESHLFTYFSRDLIELKRMDSTRDLISDDEVFSLPMKIIDLIVLNPADAAIIKASNKISRFPKDLSSDYYNENEQKPISYFDYIFYMSYQDILNDFMPDPYPQLNSWRSRIDSTNKPDPNLIPLSVDMKNFADLKSQLIIHFFDLDLKTIDDGLTSYYSSELKAQSELSETIRNYAHNLYQNDEATKKLKSFSIEIGREFDVPYLSTVMSAEYDGYMFGLKQNTHGLYVY